MNLGATIILTALALAAAAYAQQQIPRFTRSPRAALFTRAGLAVLGVIVGYVVADNVVRADGAAPLLFLLGFGTVHVPAALILMLKRAAGAGKS